MPKRTATARPVAVYARLSVTTEESVSVERQLEAARKYADARGWSVVVEGVDDGVSATKHKPEERPGWRSLLESPEPFEAVIVWKVDRLARRVLDFLHADESLRERGAGIVAVEDPVDMTTAQGRAFATMLAVFGEMEAAAISARVKAARQAIVRSGRRAGGRPPFGWQNVENPGGPGYVLAQDPERIDVVRALAERAMAGDSLYSMVRWLEAEGVKARPRRPQGSAADAPKVSPPWHEASVEAILRNPILAGMTLNNPGRKEGERLDREDVLRDADGLPVVDESVAIITPAERRSLLATLDAAKKPGTRQQAGKEPALLYGLVRCGTCGNLMHRATAASKYRQYRCARRDCARPVGISRDALEEHVVEEFLSTVGHFQVVEVEEVEEDHAPALTEIEAAISDTLASLAQDDADVAALTERLGSLKAARARARAEAEEAPAVIARRTGETFAEAWARTDDVEERRQLLLSGLEAVSIAPGGGRGRAFDSSRADLLWRFDEVAAAAS